MATNKVSKVFGKWTANVQNVQTWRAICRKFGNAHKAKGQNSALHTWNDDLAEEFTKLYDNDLRRYATTVLPTLSEKFSTRTEEDIIKLASSLKNSSLNITRGIANPMENFLHTLEGVNKEVIRHINEKSLHAIKMTRVVDRKIPVRIYKAMKEGYAKAERQKGTLYHPQLMTDYTMLFSIVLLFL
jgi:hypothetical protein